MLSGGYQDFQAVTSMSHSCHLVAICEFQSLFMKIGLRGKLLGWVGLAVVAGFGLAVWIASSQASRLAEGLATDYATELVRKHSKQVQVDVEVALDAARTLAHCLEGIRMSSGRADREQVGMILMSILDRNPDFLGVWCGWEPNAFDSADTEFINKPGHDGTGRFVPCWSRDGEKILNTPLQHYTEPKVGDYYLKPLSISREFITEPYWQEKESGKRFMTTVSVPIIVDGVAIGVAGIDITLDPYTEMVKKLKIMETGYVSIISNQAIYVAHPNSKRLGKPLVESDAWAQSFLSKIAAGEGFLTSNYSKTIGKEVYRIGMPIAFGKTQIPWLAMLSVPKEEVFAGVVQLRNSLGWIGVVATLMVLAVTAAITMRATNKLSRVTQALQETAVEQKSIASEITSRSQILADAASAQAASIEESSASMEEFAGMTAHNSQSCQDAKKVADQAQIQVDASVTQISQMDGAMQEMSAIIQTIEEISFQTNILALNAAVEAARAGEAGAGFAVVADEVRNLAKRAAEAASQTSNRISRASGINLQVSESLKQIASRTHDLSKLVEQIASASVEQRIGSEQMNQALEQMSSSTQQSAEQAGQSAHASAKILDQSLLLEEAVDGLLQVLEGGSSRR